MTLFDLFDEVDPPPPTPDFQHREVILRWRMGWLTCIRPDLNLRCYFQNWTTALLAIRGELERNVIVRIR